MNQRPLTMPPPARRVDPESSPDQELHACGLGTVRRPVPPDTQPQVKATFRLPKAPSTLQCQADGQPECRGRQTNGDTERDIAGCFKEAAVFEQPDRLESECREGGVCAAESGAKECFARGRQVIGEGKSGQQPEEE